MLYFLSILYIVLFLFANFVFFTSINYAILDTCSLFTYAEAHIGPTRLRKKFVSLHANDLENPMTTCFSDNLYYHYYNIYMAIYRLLPKGNKLRQMQVVNLSIFVICLSVIYFSFLKMFSLENLSGNAAYAIAGIFVLVVAVRSKLLLVVYSCLSDVINYFLFSLSVLFAILFSINPSSVYLFVFSLSIGLSFRNRIQDIVLFPAGLVFLMLLTPEVKDYFIFLAGCCLPSIDILKEKLFSQSGGGLLESILTFRAGSNKDQNKQSGGMRRLFLNLKDLYNIFQPGSIWVSQGAILLLTPVSIVYLLTHGLWLSVLNYILITSLLIVLSVALVEHRHFSETGVNLSSYFSYRQTYSLFFCLIFLNGYAMGTAWAAGSMVSFLYILFIFAYLIHAYHRYLTYYFSPVIAEPGLFEFEKNPPSWRFELARIVQSLPKPAVIMGNHFIHGKIHNFYGWSDDLRCVDIYGHLSDQQLVETIKKYSVTHIFLTPFSPLLHPDSTLGNERLGPLLEKRLKPLVFDSPSLRGYAVLP